MVCIQKDMEAQLKNTIAVIPSFNEAKTIGYIVSDVINMGLSALVVDDGSSDNTEREALDNGAMVIRNRKNSGKGYSVRRGIRYVREKMNYDWIILMDGDGQHHPEDIPILMKETRKGDVDVVVGNRMLYTRTMPGLRLWTNRFMSWVISSMCGQSIPDTQCGYRLIKASTAGELELETHNYDFESEMLIEAANSKLKIRSAPIRTIYGNEVSKIHPVKDALKFGKLMLKYYFKRK